MHSIHCSADELYLRTYEVMGRTLDLRPNGADPVSHEEERGLLKI
jgi:hypothetical protein